MSTPYKFIALSAVVLLITAGCTPLGQGNTNGNANSNVNANANINTSNTNSEEGESERITERQDEAETTQNNQSQTEEDTGNSSEEASAGTYTDYSEDLLARANSGDVVIFFHAAWCPTCKALDRDINSKLEDIPSNLTILKVDYDTATELRKKYGVTLQHTLVQVDANGDEITSWVGGNTLGSIESQLK